MCRTHDNMACFRVLLPQPRAPSLMCISVFCLFMFSLFNIYLRARICYYVITRTLHTHLTAILNTVFYTQNYFLRYFLCKSKHNETANAHSFETHIQHTRGYNIHTYIYFRNTLRPVSRSSFKFMEPTPSDAHAQQFKLYRCKRETAMAMARASVSPGCSSFESLTFTTTHP